MFLFLTAAPVMVTLVMSGAPLFTGSDAESLHAQLDHVIQAWQPGWVADAPVQIGGPFPRPQMFRWRHNDAEITIEVQEKADARAALAEVEATPLLAAAGDVAAAGIGDRAYVVSIPGGYSTVTVAVGSRVFTVHLHGAPDVATSLAVRVARVVKLYPRP